ncbi:VIT and vWA domain-containing protein [Pseudomarimonas arenosa]|uniref:VWA domain-containing protein n=1 Tax=Pseudomarimonas arenosa TaxID=2774145 RepID=A0AAW3ZRD1_9GAMM|nr:VIT domain-containing protein [Pseudomarimonas arenosa]MBD8527627.1 VWA domain-containing protein [Pseudomarimonas arenosa]
MSGLAAKLCRLHLNGLQMRGLSTLLLVSLLLSWGSAAADHGSAPYLVSTDGSVEQLPLVMTSVDVAIAGVIADVRVTQVFENRGELPIEAVYVFPGSDRAAIQALQMRIGDRVIRAAIREKAVARAEYEEAQTQGKTASLLEQLDPSIFRMSIANVLPGDRIEVELRYTELLVPTRGVYEFFYPNTVGERFTQAGDKAIRTPTSTDSKVSDFAFNISARLVGALPLGEVGSPSHDVDVEQPSAHEALVTLDDDAQRDAGKRDYRLRFRYAGERIESGLMSFREGDGGYFLLLAEPPQQVDAAIVVPREFIFVIDVSGSMVGKPLEITKDLLGDLVSSLRPTDVFNLLLFSGGSDVFAENRSVAATPENVQRARDFIGASNAGGGTELVSALETAYRLPSSPGFSRSIIIVTDGAISAGGAAFSAIRSRLDQANTFAFGIGPSVESAVIRLLARAGAGEPFIVGELGEGKQVATRLRQYIDRPVLTDIKLEASGVDIFDLEPLQVPDLLAERPVVVVGRFRGSQPGTVSVSGTSGRSEYRQELTLDPGNADPSLHALRQMWGRERIQGLLDEQAGNGWWSGYQRSDAIDHSAEITKLALDYSLLTPYTSFVAIDERIRNDGESVRVEQPAVAKGVGHHVVQSLSLAASAAAPALVSSPASDRTLVAARSFVLRDGVWTDEAFGDQVVLRVRPDSQAWQQLLLLCPELAEYRLLGDSVLIAFGRYAVLLTPRGFSDYPADLLAQAVLPARG